VKRILALALFAAVALAGCLNGENISGNAISNVLYVHDDEHGVGCWYFSAGGVDCMPDSEYESGR
jgi:hypothetical protein